MTVVDIVAAVGNFLVMQLAKLPSEHLRLILPLSHICRAGGTGAAGTAMAVPVFSDRVICPRPGPYQFFSIRVILPKPV